MNPASFNYFVSLIEDVTGDIQFTNTTPANVILEGVITSYVKVIESYL